MWSLRTKHIGDVGNNEQYNPKLSRYNYWIKYSIVNGEEIESRPVSVDKVAISGFLDFRKEFIWTWYFPVVFNHLRFELFWEKYIYIVIFSHFSIMTQVV